MAEAETQVRTYSIRDTERFERDRADLAEEGWEVARISNRDDRQGFFWSLIAAFGLLGRSSSDLVVTYRRRDSGTQ